VIGHVIGHAIGHKVGGMTGWVLGRTGLRRRTLGVLGMRA